MMDMSLADHRAESVSPRLALLSILGVWLFYSFIVTIRAVLLDFPAQGEMAWRRMVVSIIGIGITWLFYLALRAFDWRNLGLRVAMAALIALPCAVTIAAANHVMFSVYDPMSLFPEEGQSSAAQTTDPAHIGKDSRPTLFVELAESSINRYFVLIAWASLYLALSYANRLSLSERRTARLELSARQAELRSLRYQVNPHFLFNTLNSLSSLVMSNRRDEAETMIMNLAYFYRTSLAGDPLDDVQLEEEAELQRLYLGIEGVRFPDRLKSNIDIPAELRECCVPGLILQPLVENAIKYGVSPARKPVSINIGAAEQDGRLHLWVENDGGPPFPQLAGEAHGTGIGLANVRDRLAARFGGEASLLAGPRPGGGWRAELILPRVMHDC
jgi:two-component system, LytTR family, sensor kinase